MKTFYMEMGVNIVCVVIWMLNEGKMLFFNLTDEKGKKIVINMEFVTTFFTLDSSNEESLIKTCVVFSNNEFICVQESVEEISRNIK